MKKLLTCLVTLILSLAFVTPVLAFDHESGSAAMLSIHEPTTDTRVAKLTAFLESYNPELSPFAKNFIYEADQYGLDWKFVAAISGVESTFCRHIPSGSYNCWGWGIPTGAQTGIEFSSIPNGIHTVSMGLRSNYIDRGLLTVEEIGSVYAASPMWATRVRYFMNLIENDSKSLVSSAQTLL